MSANYNSTAAEVTETSQADFNKRKYAVVHRNVNNEKVSHEITHTIKIASSAPGKPHFFAAPIKGTRYSAQRPRVTKYAVEHIIDFIGRTLTCKSIILRTSHLVT